ncbi:Mur ligase family protein [Photobacterium sp. GSS17]|uniref:Mur ligase family protein n=1 Tax=Photobacterium sp. GSS17 TaxID=3020715 RepID=UPI002360B98E|nr:UDP-N-acetylmuramoyl-L-alanyl-D-glutamate--2,6-diaminopimelate ligase [Photobacterium sp. GSS17]
MNSSHHSLLATLNTLDVKAFKTHSQKIQPGDVFVCRQGLTWDSHLSATDAVNRGAIAVIANRQLDISVPCLVSPSHSTSISLINQYYQYPQDKLKHIGVTGTNGKTTVAYCLSQLLNIDGMSAYTGTLGSAFANVFYPLDNTTPDAITLLNLFHAMQQAGVTHHVMEVSSHALSQDRVTHIDFDAVVITNIGSDHLDYHRNREDYIQAKLRLIDRLKPGGTAVVNLDDEQVVSVLDRCRSKYAMLTFSRYDPDADLYAQNITATRKGATFVLHYGGETYPVATVLPFDFNIENTLVMLALLVASGLNMSDAVNRLGALQPAPGRSEVYTLANGATVILDYAHNYDSLLNLYQNVRGDSPVPELQVTGSSALMSQENGAGRVLTVIGVTGERLEDAPEIGRLCAGKSDHVVFTTDNPLGVDQSDMFSALTRDLDASLMAKAVIVPDRALAIEQAVNQLMPNDVLLLCGKGHEEYQYISLNKHDAEPYMGDLAALRRAAIGRGWSVDDLEAKDTLVHLAIKN